MRPKDKYTTYTPYARGYRKGIHKVPKWTRVRAISYAMPLILITSRLVDTSDEPPGFLRTLSIACFTIQYATRKILKPRNKPRTH